MFNLLHQISNFSKFFNLIAALLVLGISLSGQAYTSGVNNDPIDLDDPYNCGGRISGEITSGVTPYSVKVELSDDGTVVETFTPTVESDGYYETSLVHESVDSGVYQLTSIATDDTGDTDTWEEEIHVKKPDECSIAETVRTGASRLANQNFPLFAAIAFIVPIGAFITTKQLVFKPKKVER
jgi:hypothetical protein